MKAILKYSFLSLVLLLSFGLQSADAQVRPAKRRAVRREVVRHNAAHRVAVSRTRARRFIRRTNLAIYAAHKQVKEHRVFTGDLSRAYHHQRVARRLYRRRAYRRAVYHSRRARLLAYAAIKANKGKVNSSFDWEQGDEELYDGMPGDAELDAELIKELGNVSYNDEDLIKKDIKGEIDFDENDMGPEPK